MQSSKANFQAWFVGKCYTTTLFRNSSIETKLRNSNEGHNKALTEESIRDALAKALDQGSTERNVGYKMSREEKKQKQNKNKTKQLRPSELKKARGTCMWIGEPHVDL